MSPDFLCIGAQKAGTTWLYRNLESHPQVWLPPVKELHYFDNPHRVPLIFKFVGSRKQNRRARKEVRRFLSVMGDSPRRNWYRRFLFHPRNDPWYSSLFSPGTNQLAGEMSPSYATLSEGRVAHIHAVLPELKIIFLIRNPIQRTWSSAAMYFSKQGQPSLDDVDERHLMDYFRKRGSQRRSDYLRTLQIWEKHYAPRQIFIGFFDQLEQAPGLLLRDIYRFLSIDDSAQHIPERVSEKVNARSYPQMPTEISEYLTQQFSVQIQQLHQRFANEYTAAWLRSIQE